MYQQQNFFKDSWSSNRKSQRIQVLEEMTIFVLGNERFQNVYGLPLLSLEKRPSADAATMVLDHFEKDVLLYESSKLLISQCKNELKQVPRLRQKTLQEISEYQQYSFEVEKKQLQNLRRRIQYAILKEKHARTENEDLRQRMGSVLAKLREEPHIQKMVKEELEEELADYDELIEKEMKPNLPGLLEKLKAVNEKNEEDSHFEHELSALMK